MLYNALLSTVKVSFPDLFVDPAMTKEKFGLKPLLPWHDAPSAGTLRVMPCKTMTRD